jgi:hypothetical protein
VRPKRELKAFAKVALAPREEKRVTLQIQARGFAYFDLVQRSWLVKPCELVILVGASSQDLVLLVLPQFWRPPQLGIRHKRSPIGFLQFGTDELNRESGFFVPIIAARQVTKD